MTAAATTSTPNASAFGRTGCYAGLLVTLAVGGWFTLQTRLGVAPQFDVAIAADTALAALLLAQLLALMVTVALQDAGSDPGRSIPAITMLMLVPAPLLIVLWQAGSASGAGIVTAEIASLAVALGLALLVGALDRLVPRRLADSIVKSGLALTLIAAWSWRGLWPHLLGL